MTELTTEQEPAFAAAYDALAQYTSHEQIRAQVAHEIATRLWEQRSLHGTAFMVQMSSDETTHRQHIDSLMSSLRAQHVQVGPLAVSHAIRAVAKLLAAG